MSDWTTLFQWTGWASFGTVVVALLTLWLKDRWERGKLGVEQAKVAVSAKAVEMTAAEVVIHERTADATILEMMTTTYQGLISTLKEQVDDLEERLGKVEGREQECLKRVEVLETDQDRLQAALWRLRNPNNG